MSAPRRLLPAVVAGVATAVVRGGLDWQPPGGAATWTRTNHRGEPVSLLEGPAVAAGVLAGALVGGGARATLATAVAALGGGAFGLVDDLREDSATRTKGLRGHLGALARGRVTTGGLKVLGIGASALVAAAVAPPGGGAASKPLARTADTLASAALVAGAANLLNLLDLRPGRALKAASLAAAPLVGTAGGAAACAVLGAASTAVEADLAETDMLGDAGANAVGAVLGTAVVLGAPRPVRLAVLGVVVALTLVSERVSFTRVIERTPVLREVDAWGRRPVSSPATGAAAGGPLPS
ncbi:hypothetical protein [Cellulomonas dongxiuzhuiae]|uniref:UDP-N-acetylmuramyl pentapeptide phosphotransferase/UDP-N-acetylglucosamine-1-phosphate transferase n=1 Tax=Cellulomonas dongxiuzhuiae TaxID=2819979 RepID=A0ABX8GNJ6_9CELL|nr:hypothetical protein [Cellulomonas dongxiuzhuiae]MBO3093218.1 hypothetical protein [Cellulomonas dongxiuzhuiae]QWC17508.1 hypothetical protein KKR89_08105 [Cellulomonas dongxiuzhuiae]